MRQGELATAQNLLSNFSTPSQASNSIITTTQDCLNICIGSQTLKPLGYISSTKLNLYIVCMVELQNIVYVDFVQSSKLGSKIVKNAYAMFKHCL